MVTHDSVLFIPVVLRLPDHRRVGTGSLYDRKLCVYVCVCACVCACARVCVCVYARARACCSKDGGGGEVLEARQRR
jgi:hypothetical protein